MTWKDTFDTRRRTDTYGAGSGGGSSLSTKLKIAGVVGALALVGSCGLYNSFFTYIKPYEFALKQSRLGGGIEKKVYSGGYMYFEGFGVRFHRFPRTWQVLDFNDETKRQELEESIEGYNHQPQVQIPSTDGFMNHFDITVIYRITDPSIVIDKDRSGIGIGRAFEEYVRTKVDTSLKETVGKLKAEDLYNVEKRQEAVKATLTLLNRELQPSGIQVGDVLVRNFKYNEKYESKIHGKVLQDRLLETNVELAKMEEMKAQVVKMDAEGQAQVNTEKKRGESEAKKKVAEADNYSRQRAAEGTLLEEQANAEGQELINRAYEGFGSGKIVGIEMAQKAKAIKKVYVKSCRANGVNPLDLGEILRKFTATGGAQ